MLADHSEQLLNFLLEHRPVFVLTGAGCSTRSGIPDYRDRNGDWKHARPIQFNDFVKHPAMRQRYWARSMRGWPRIQQARPNASHTCLVRLEQAGFIRHLVTQNVDGLHRQAGSQALIELHGQLGTVSCMACGKKSHRAEIQDFLLENNPGFQTAAGAARPDGDTHSDEQDLSGFCIPKCAKCAGVLKPDVVFFGESVPRCRVDHAMQELQQSQGLLSIGSSLMVFSGYRFCRAARQWGLASAALNLGRTRADKELTLKIEADCGEVLSTIMTKLNG